MPLPQRAAAPYPRSITGPRGVTVRAKPQRIVAASVFSTEVLSVFVPRERIAAVIALAADPRYCAVADVAATLPQCGASPEELLALRPDLVVTDPFTAAETRALLQQVEVPVWEIRPIRTLGDVVDNIRLLGWLTGCDEAAESLAQATEARASALRARAAAASPWRVLNLTGGTGSYGRGTLLDDAIAATGAVNLAGAHGLPPYRELELEELLGMDPDALLMSTPPDGDERARERLRQLPGIQLLSCVQRDRIVFVPGTAFGATSHFVLTAAERLQAQLLAWGRP